MEKQNNLNAMLIDQQVLGIVDANRDLFPTERWNDEGWMKPAALKIGEPDDGGFEVTPFQGKYCRDLIDALTV